MAGRRKKRRSKKRTTGRRRRSPRKPWDPPKGARRYDVFAKFNYYGDMRLSDMWDCADDACESFPSGMTRLQVSRAIREAEAEGAELITIEEQRGQGRFVCLPYKGKGGMYDLKCGRGSSTKGKLRNVTPLERFASRFAKKGH